MNIRLYLDEHIDPDLAHHLQRLGYDVLSAAEAGRAGLRIPDEEQLALDAEWKAAGREHAGIILSPELALSPLCRRVEAHLQRYTADQHHNLHLWC